MLASTGYAPPGALAAREWRGFPDGAVAIGFNTLGDYVVLLPQGRKQRLADTVLWWDHETCDLDVLANSIEELPDVDPQASEEER